MKTTKISKNDQKSVHSNNDLVDNKSNTSDALGELATEIFIQVLLLSIPAGVLAWLFIGWGGLWLLFPVLFLVFSALWFVKKKLLDKK